MGDGPITLTAAGLLLRGISPFLGDVEIINLSIDLEKKGDKVSLESLDMEISGLSLKGKGTIYLKKTLGKSRLDISGHIQLDETTDGPLKGFIPILQGIGGGGSRFEVALSGELDSPKLSINGKQVL